MEFWGAEVKPGKPLKVKPDEDTLIHISQASLGESKDKKGEPVPLFLKIGDQKLVMGTLSQEHFPQISFDLVFEKEFELSHNWKNGSVYFIGYKSPNVDAEDEEGFFSGSEESGEEDVPVPAPAAENGNANAEKAKAAKPEAKPKAKAAEVKKEAKPEPEDDDSDEEDFSDEDGSSDSEEGMDVDEDSDDDEDDDEGSDEEDEETPKKVEQSKKRANESASKTPVPAKKAKAAATPQKTDPKKGGHTATPHPAKKGGKTPANASQSPKSGGQFSCGSCKKSFNSDGALQSHNKAKHSGK